MKNVDEVCREIKNKEEKINLLFMTQGTLDLTSSMFVIECSVPSISMARLTLIT